MRYYTSLTNAKRKTRSYNLWDNKETFFDEVASSAVADSFEIREVNEYCIVLAKRNTSFGAALLFGSRYNTTPEERMTFTVIEVSGGIRIFATSAIVTNLGSAFEKTTQVEKAADIQTALEKMKARYGN